MFVGIDGTGKWNNQEYAQEMRGSFVEQLYHQSADPVGSKLYLRGPSLLGLETLGIAQRAVHFILAAKHRDARQRVFMAGWSRGGAACIYAARTLQSFRVEVDCLILFDAVDRDVVPDLVPGVSAYCDPQAIPGNVRHAYHALRDPKVGSRWYFGNCGVSISPPGKLDTKVFSGTHAALGGTPWTGDHPTRTELRPVSPTAYANEDRWQVVTSGVPARAQPMIRQEVELPTRRIDPRRMP